VATIDDYAATHELVADLVAAGVEASVPQTVRETVEAVKALKTKCPEGVPQSAVKAHLSLDKSTVSHRSKHAIELGHLIDEQEKRGPACPTQARRPSAGRSRGAAEAGAVRIEPLQCCSVSGERGGTGTIPIRGIIRGPHHPRGCSSMVMMKSLTAPQTARRNRNVHPSTQMAIRRTTLSSRIGPRTSPRNAGRNSHHGHAAK